MARRSMHWREAFAALVIILLFVLGSVFAQAYESQLLTLFEGRGVEGVFLYLLFILVSYVIAPISSLVVFPIVLLLWGPVVASVVSIIGWTLGSLLTYYLSRTFGRPLVERFVDTARIKKYEQALPEKHKFVGLVIINAIFPTDVLGYVLGLVLRVPYAKYALACVIGNIPFVIMLVFAARLSLAWQLGIAAIGILAIAFGSWKIADKLTQQ